MSQSEVAQVEYKQQILVYGFMRMSEQINYIPDELIRLCLLFYLILCDEWDTNTTKSEDFKINRKQNSVTSIAGSIQQAFGGIIVEKGQYQDWKIKANRVSGLQSHLFVLFGITDIDFVPAKKIFSYNGIGYYSYSGKIYTNKAPQDYGKSWNNNDVITMILDMTNNKFGKLSFKINDEDQGIVSEDIDINKKYCMAIAMSTNTTAKIISAWP